MERPTEDQIRAMMEKVMVIKPPASAREMVDDLRYLFMLMEIGILILAISQVVVFWHDFTDGKRVDSCFDIAFFILLVFTFFGTMHRSHKYRVWLDATEGKK